MLNTLLTRKFNNISIMKIKPLQDSVLIEPQESEKKTAGGIIIPDSATEKPQKGKVVAVGNGIEDKKMTTTVNDIVLYGKFSGTKLNIDDKEYLIMKESDILAII